MWLILALSAAICFGIRGILYHWSSQQAMDRNLMLFGVFFTGLVASLILAIATKQVWTYGSLFGILMGFFSFVANGSMYKGFATGKASIVAIFTSLPPLVVVILAYLLWKESLNFWQASGFIVILIGVVFIRYSSDLSLSNMRAIQWGLLAMLFFGLNDITSKQSTLSTTSIYPTLFYMFSTGSLLFFLLWINIKIKMSSTKLMDTRKTFLWGMFVGITNIFGMIFILSAFAQGITSLVSVIVSMNVLILLFYFRVFLKEKFNRMEVTGIIFSLTGIVILHLLG